MRLPLQRAIVLGSQELTYGELWGEAGRVAAAIEALAPVRDTEPFVAVLGTRSVSTYTGLLGVVLAGRAYLPLEPEQPPARLAALLGRSGVSWIVADRAGLPLVSEICAHVDRPVHVLLTDEPWDDVDLHGSRLVTIDGAGVPADAAAPAITESDPLYLLFTSGSTGEPKGVVIEHGNVAALLRGLGEDLDLDEQDVVAQLFKLSFDPSVMMMLLAWTTGATLAVPTPDSGVLDEAALIDRHGVTVWGGVPSRTTIMRRLRQLRPGAYPGLRYVLQGGEALTVDVCDAWTAAAPNARVINQYGPTEATVCATHYVWDPASSPAECDGSRVPIGVPLAGVDVAVVDEGLEPITGADTGELLVGGPQVARGYLGAPDRTAAAFIELAGREGRFYRTGDLVRRPRPSGPLYFAGRTDDQVKVLGRRIELGEVESVVRAVLAVDQVAALAWPETAGGYDGVEVFVAGPVPADARARLSERLPPEAVPRRLHSLDELPLTRNGKTDRRLLRERLDGRGPQPATDA